MQYEVSLKSLIQYLKPSTTYYSEAVALSRIAQIERLEKIAEELHEINKVLCNILKTQR